LPDKITGMASALPRRAPRKRLSPSSSLVIHNVVVAGRRTSVRLEPVMWEALQEIVRQQETNVNQLVTEIDRRRNSSSLTAAIRVYIVDFYRSAAAAQGDRAAEVRARLTS
jgi:predicted DNA-binding ribbon-helix-helix protein